MKYNSKNTPLVCMQTNSTCYKRTSKMTVKGVLWHSTGVNNPYLSRYVQPSDNASDREYWLKLLGKNKYNNDWNHINRQAGLNAWIGKLADGTVTTVQTMPWDYKPWGCGAGSKGSCNSSHLQFEICEDGLTDKTYFDKVYKEACELTAYLCDMHNLDPHGTVNVNGVKTPVILCHKDSYKLGLGSGHADVYHWFNKYGKTMDDVRNDVAALMKRSGSTSTSTSPTPSFSVLEFKVGDIVNFVGNKHYGSSNATTGKTVKASKAKVIGVYKNGKHPYQLRAVDDKGKFISGVYGWVDASTVSEIKVETVVKKPDVIYQVYADGKWWGEIKNYNETNSNGYAGVLGKEISGIRVKLSNGKTVTLRSHLSGNARNDWLSEITKWDNTNNGYSGWKGKPIDCITMKADGYTLKYRVHIKGGKWLSWISKYDINDYAKGLAGTYGKPIDAMQIMVV